jgi:hypothetical protein
MAEKKPATLPPAAADVALIDAAKCAAIGCMSVSWWNAEVLAGRAPPPAFRKNRCTRWRLADVREFWRKFAEQDSDSEAVRNLADQTAKARAARRLAKAKVAQ